ncbi:MAG: nucleotidyltransferase, partial [Bacteroides sp.]
GSVARGVCEKDANDYLTTVVERTAIERIDGKVSFKDENGKMVCIDDNTPVSMNMWGFTPDYFKYSEDFFINFLKENSSNLKSEYFIPLMVNELINNGTARVKVLDTTSKWFGVTYAADRQSVVDKIKALVDAGEYPSKLF